MKIKDVRELFGNCKMYVGTRSEEVQNKLFSLGFKWREARTDDKQVPRYIDKPFLYIIKGIITYGESFSYFKKDKLKEVYVELLLNVPITSSFKPFSNKEECWNEMLKHQPFGWLVNKETGCYVQPILYTSITAVFADNSSSNFNSMFKKFTFADGEPFGIKEGE